MVMTDIPTLLVSWSPSLPPHDPRGRAALNLLQLPRRYDASQPEGAHDDVQH